MRVVQTFCVERVSLLMWSVEGEEEEDGLPLSESTARFLSDMVGWRGEGY